MSRIALGGSGRTLTYTTRRISSLSFVVAAITLVVVGPQWRSRATSLMLKVSEGKIDFVEIYTYGDVRWPDEPDVVSFGKSTPVPVSRRATCNGL